MTTSKTLVSLLFALLTIPFARAGASPSNTWQMQVGWVHQWGRGMSVGGPAPSITAGSLPMLPLGGRTLLPSGGANITDLTLMRVFDSGGYVGPDAWTGDAGLRDSSDPADRERYGMTWNWGANASQYNPATHELIFHVTDRDAVLGAQTLTGGTTDDSMPTEGVEIKFSRSLLTWTNTDLTLSQSGLSWTNGNASLDLVLGLAWFPQVNQHVARQASLGVYSIDETYTYIDYYGTSAGGSLPDVGMPYAGTAGGPGPLIPELPASWTYTTLDRLGTVRDDVSVSSEIWHLRGEIGLTLTKDLTSRLSAYVSPQFVLEFVDMHADRHEAVTYTDDHTAETTALSSRSESKHKETIVPGLLLSAGANYLVSQNWYVGASFGWEWLARDPSISVGSSRVRFDLDGGEFSLYLGRHF